MANLHMRWVMVSSDGGQPRLEQRWTDGVPAKASIPRQTRTEAVPGERATVPSEVVATVAPLPVAV